MESVVYLLVRNDLSMGKGKIGGQCGHAVQGLCLQSSETLMKSYVSSGSVKIVVKVSDEKELIRFLQLARSQNYPCYLVRDAGKTQLEPDTATVLGIGPIPRSTVPSELQNLKLL